MSDKSILEDIIEAAAKHGRAGDFEQEVGNLQQLLRAAWKIMTPQQRIQFWNHDTTTDILSDNALPPVEQLKTWQTELDEIISHLAGAIMQSTDRDDRIIMDHVKAAHEIAKKVRDAAEKAKSLGARLSPQAAERVKAAIDVARKAATEMKIVRRKAGATDRTAEAEIERLRDRVVKAEISLGTYDADRSSNYWRIFKDKPL